MTMLDMSRVEGMLNGRLKTIHGSTYKDNSTVIVIPTRGQIDYRVVASWQSLMAPMNGKRVTLFAVGHEVGKAYNEMVQAVLADPNISKWKYLLCLEDDNIPPTDAHIRLLESMHETDADGVGGLYWTKGELGVPLALGDPDLYRRTGELEFRPRDLRPAVAEKARLVEVNGLPQGCTLFKMDLFRRIPAPWFVTVNDFTAGRGAAAFTQDLDMATKAKKAGARFFIDLAVKVGHVDTSTGEVW